MSDQASDLQAAIGSTGTPSTASGYEIAPEDQHYADAILAIDPLRDVPTPHSFPAGWSMPALKASALPPALAKTVNAQLMALPEGQRAEREPTLSRRDPGDRATQNQQDRRKFL